MAKSFIWVDETRQHINEFKIGYTVSPNLNKNNSFREQVDKCMNNTFGPIAQPHIISTIAKINTRVLELLMFYETRNNPKKYFKVLRCVIYTIISNYVCIDYLACESETIK